MFAREASASARLALIAFAGLTTVLTLMLALGGSRQERSEVGAAAAHLRAADQCDPDDGHCIAEALEHERQTAAGKLPPPEQDGKLNDELAEQQATPVRLPAEERGVVEATAGDGVLVTLGPDSGRDRMPAPFDPGLVRVNDYWFRVEGSVKTYVWATTTTADGRVWSGGDLRVMVFRVDEFGESFVRAATYYGDAGAGGLTIIEAQASTLTIRPDTGDAFDFDVDRFLAEHAE